MRGEMVVGWSSGVLGEAVRGCSVGGLGRDDLVGVVCPWGLLRIFPRGANVEMSMATRSLRYMLGLGRFGARGMACSQMAGCSWENNALVVWLSDLKGRIWAWKLLEDRPLKGD
jgi:hypothetical protein